MATLDHFVITSSFLMAFLLTTVRGLSECPSACDCSFLSSGESLIDCSNRGLTEVVPVAHQGVLKIAKIDFSNNMLTALDVEVLFSLIAGIQVDELDFSFNSISVVKGTFSANLGKDYETLNLSSNALTSFPSNVIPKVHWRANLILDFSNNQLTELTSEMFAGGDIFFPGFQFLARNNSISRIHNDTFEGVILVDTVLDLRSNQITTLSEGFRSPLGVQAIKLSDNPWHCDCNLRWITDPARYLITYTAFDPPNCSTPVPLRGKKIFTLNANEFACLPFQDGVLHQDITNTDEFTLTCPVSADPPDLEISWNIWFSCPTMSVFPIKLSFITVDITFSDIMTSSWVAIQCIATNNAGSLTLDLDIRVNETSTPIPTSNGPLWSTNKMRTGV
ncbi:Protein slit [Holothuria leucospilota]|uniref:Protein slit n=1 Tax=Holothuria leucospilota TaxID=206669 RepID=A0A9Q1H223_HOLLE|nr:Protein slit [Holothuria leucospilota]